MAFVATNLKSACSAQLVQVVLQRSRLRLIQIQGASLSNSNSLQYNQSLIFLIIKKQSINTAFIQD